MQYNQRFIAENTAWGLWNKLQWKLRSVSGHSLFILRQIELKRFNRFVYIRAYYLLVPGTVDLGNSGGGVEVGGHRSETCSRVLSVEIRRFSSGGRLPGLILETRTCGVACLGGRIIGGRSDLLREQHAKMELDFSTIFLWYCQVTWAVRNGTLSRTIFLGPREVNSTVGTINGNG